jgi:CheY-like chemotaxis protein
MIAPEHTPVSRSFFQAQVHFSSQLLPAENLPPQSTKTSERLSTRGAENIRSVLVVDDVSDVTDMLSVLLTHAGYNVAAAGSAKAAIELASQRQFDMVISDIGMPEMNGYELARALRKIPGYDSVTMVAVTGYSMFDDRSRSLAAGFNEHVTKPIDPRAFLDLIEQL